MLPVVLAIHTDEVRQVPGIIVTQVTHSYANHSVPYGRTVLLYRIKQLRKFVSMVLQLEKE